MAVSTVIAVPNINQKETIMFKVYFSHSIRGKKGADCTLAEQKINCSTAIAMAGKIRAACPWLDLYVPAENEEFVAAAFAGGYLENREILEVDCLIANNYSDAMVLFIPEGDELQGGRLYEFNHAIHNCIPTHQFSRASKAIAFLTELYEYQQGGTSTGFGKNADE